MIFEMNAKFHQVETYEALKLYIFKSWVVCFKMAKISKRS